MKALLIILTIFLFGCTTVPVTVPFPDAPDKLLLKCGELSKIENKEENRKLSILEKTVAVNYGKYHKCSTRNDEWIEWYKSQKQNFEKLNKK